MNDIILQNWHLSLADTPPSAVANCSTSSPTTWTPPPTGFIKINFDGASKGNPGPAGFGAILRNSNGEILHLVAGYLGFNTNNVAELWSLLRGIKIATDHHYNKIIAEGDSQIIVHLITKILHGEHPLEVSPSWRLSGLLEDFGSLLRPSLTIIPSHVKRDANKVADFLENEGVATMTELIHWNAQTSPRSELSDRCQDLARMDSPTPDGVTRSTQGPRNTRPKPSHKYGRLAPIPSPLIMGATLTACQEPRMAPSREQSDGKEIQWLGGDNGRIHVTLLVITQQCTSLHHFSFDLHQVSSLVLWCSHCKTFCNFPLALPSRCHGREASVSRPCLV
jgi:ribonuclease HI